jgi:hypothetical protein
VDDYTVVLCPDDLHGIADRYGYRCPDQRQEDQEQGFSLRHPGCSDTRMLEILEQTALREQSDGTIIYIQSGRTVHTCYY